MDSRPATRSFRADWSPRIANRQWGVFTRAQAVEAGMTVAQVRHRLRTGLWIPVAGKGIRLAAPTPQPAVPLIAAALTWPDAVVCWQSAAAWHGLPVPHARSVHVWVPVDRRPVLNLVPHRFELGAEHEELGPLRFTSRMRSITDALAHLPGQDADALAAWALTRRLVSRDDIESALGARPGAWGSAQLRRILTETRTGALSAAERELHRLLRRAGLTGWAANATVVDGSGIAATVDVLFAAERVAIEVDGRKAHGPEAFQRDRTRQNRLVLCDHLVLRFTWADLTRRPGETIAQIRRALERRRPARRR